MLNFLNFQRKIRKFSVKMLNFAKKFTQIRHHKQKIRIFRVVKSLNLK